MSKSNLNIDIHLNNLFNLVSRDKQFGFQGSMQRSMNQEACHQQPAHRISFANAKPADRPSIQIEDKYHLNYTPDELLSPLTSKSALLKAAGLITGTTFNLLIALCIPSKVVR